MLLRNFPLNNGRPHGREQTNNYVKALDIKQEVEQVAATVVRQNGEAHDLNPSDNAVVLDNDRFSTGSNLGRSDIRGFASFQGTAENPESVQLQVDVYPTDAFNTRILTRRPDGDLIRYTRQFNGNEAVEHMVHDTATDTFNYFLRNPKGQFLSKG